MLKNQRIGAWKEEPAGRHSVLRLAWLSAADTAQCLQLKVATRVRCTFLIAWLSVAVFPPLLLFLPTVRVTRWSPHPRVLTWFQHWCKFYGIPYLLTHSTVQSPSWAANWFAASQEIPRISRNPKVHYRSHNRPPPVSILGQPNPVHIPTSHLLQIHPNNIHT